MAAWGPIHEVWRGMLGDDMWALQSSGWEDRKRAEVESHIREHTQWALVTEQDGRIVGFLTYRLHDEKRVGEIGNNAVDPACQGRGVGTRQCERALELFREAGMVAAMVTTGLDEGHAPARTMYEKVGFNLSTPHVRYCRWL